MKFVFDNCEIVGHKLILSESNSGFREMFEKSAMKNCERIEITDIESTTFKKLLHVDTTEFDVCPKLLLAANTFSIASLVKICEDLIPKNLTTENVVNVFIKADSVNVGVLKVKCMTFIFDNNFEVVKTDWTNQHSVTNSLRRAVALVRLLMKHLLLEKFR